jgi:hypothetical protein
MKYLHRYNGEGDVIVEEHLLTFYSFVENFNIEHENVWMRLFVQSLVLEDWLLSLMSTLVMGFGPQD